MFLPILSFEFYGKVDAYDTTYLHYNADTGNKCHLLAMMEDEDLRADNDKNVLFREGCLSQVEIIACEKPRML